MLTSLVKTRLVHLQCSLKVLPLFELGITCLIDNERAYFYVKLTRGINFRVKISSWIFELGFELRFRVGFSRNKSVLTCSIICEITSKFD